MSRSKNEDSNQSPAVSDETPSAHPAWKRWLAAFGAGLLMLALIGGAAADWWISEPADAPRRHVGRKSCVQCHAKQNKDWTGSDHDLAMSAPTDQTVLGNFDNATFEHYGVKSRMFRKGKEFFVATEGRDGKEETFQVRYTFGVRPLQQYLVAFPEDENQPRRASDSEDDSNLREEPRLQALPLAWNTEDKKWFFLDLEEERITPDDVLHWTGRAMNWNHMCAECHSTNLHKNYDVEKGKYHTTFSETDVSCEACHGPGSLHVELAEAKSLFWDRRHGYGLAKLKRQSPVHDPKDETYRRQIETCGRCHARRHAFYPGHEAGEPFLDHFLPELLDSEVYHPDGQIRPEEEGYVYGSFLQSKMFRKGVRCTDCHDPHTAKTHAKGNQLCAKCHQPAKFDTSSHHHHKVDSRGARCVECHMPETTYMHVDPRRDHSIRVPRPDLSVKLGTPNACNNCHLKKEGGGDKKKASQWAADHVVKWFGPDRKQDPHFGEIIARGRRVDLKVEEDLIRLSEPRDGDRDVGPLVRASAVALLGLYRDADAERALASRLSDPEALVRSAAIRAFEDRVGTWNQAEAVKKSERFLPLLSDRSRAVRVGAAQVLSQYRLNQIPFESHGAFRAAQAEFMEGLLLNNDQAGAHHALGLLEERKAWSGSEERARKHYQSALGHYETALGLDPYYQFARVRLAAVHQQNQNLEQAEAVLREGLERIPKGAGEAYRAGVHYRMGLFLRESRRLGEAVEFLAKAADLADADEDLLPQAKANFRYNYGWTL
ncbi:MAG: tetratricopeptide repeat protein, partial [Planctomycetales bacterium]